ncbi:DUF1800 domain-containing protein [Hyphococcus flavus]|uniref:DUF1800 domain-containing protein n=1 Tax=Hyphococcus flavus TaxID=1866326 RepID=A0AAE9Z9X5_9PROT|nr:DUF1800 domain-containing protein [Hyphococcus flavus]WDI30158.1 DUF1800 domain-containing protein [Hyphococcus flavus]
MSYKFGWTAIATAVCMFFVAGCSSSEESPPPETPPGTLPPPTASITASEASRFLNQATFGATAEEIERLQSMGYAAWISAEFAKPQESLLQSVLLVEASGAEAGQNELSETFWTRAIVGDDQLRQRVGFSLSQILVASYSDGMLAERPVAMANYMDMMSAGAFGNFRQTLENITYSPAMAIWLTYLQNQKADEEGEVVPDENYAREIMQLFTIGTLELGSDGQVRLDGMGEPIETYDNSDVTELAKVFTGLSWAERGQFLGRPDTVRSEYLPLVMFEAEHSPEAKSFLGVTIPPNTPGDQSIAIALDALFNHPNTAPFISRQLIQRLVTSNPSPQYVGRVANAFRSGRYVFAGGEVAGGSGRGDMRAVVAAILMDDEARDAAFMSDPAYGKLREPVIRFTHWARAFGVTRTNIDAVEDLRDTRAPSSLNQQAYRSPSVFNFYRPGFVAPGTESAAAGLVAPELQITTAASVTGYANFMDEFIVNRDNRANIAPDYSPELALAGDPSALVDHLDLLLTAGALSGSARSRIIDAVNAIDSSNGTFTRNDLRVRTAILLIMTSSDYIVSR